MSEMVHYSGKLEVVDTLPDETLEEQCKRILAKHNYFELDSYCDSWREMLCEELYERYVIANDTIYEVVEKKHRSIDEDIFEAHANLDGSIEYEVMYYNGGCSFNEAIEYALEDMKQS